jgi:hypothetical protein
MLVLTWGGAALSFAAMASYFVVVPRWPDLRDSGHASVALALAGVAMSIVGLRRSRVPGTRRWPAALACWLGAASAAFLAAYIYYLSYQLPGSEGVIEVGSRAPDFRLRDQEGRERPLSELAGAGHRLVVVFFRGHW